MIHFLKQYGSNVLAFGMRWQTLAEDENIRSFAATLRNEGLTHYVPPQNSENRVGAATIEQEELPLVFAAALVVANNYPHAEFGNVVIAHELQDDLYWLFALDSDSPKIDRDLVINGREKAEKLLQEWIAEFKPQTLSAPIDWEVESTFDLEIASLEVPDSSRLKSTAGLAARAAKQAKKYALLLGLVVVAAVGGTGYLWHLDQKEQEAQAERIADIRAKRQAREQNKPTEIVAFAATHPYAYRPSVYSFLRACVDQGFNNVAVPGTWLVNDKICDGSEFVQHFTGQGKFRHDFLEDLFVAPAFEIEYTDFATKARVVQKLHRIEARQTEREPLEKSELYKRFYQTYNVLGGVTTFSNEDIALDLQGAQLTLLTRGKFSVSVEAPPSLWGRYLDEIPGVVLSTVTLTNNTSWTIEGFYYVSS